jgi:hypothetical protein
LNLDRSPVSVTAKPDEGVLVGVPGGVPRLIKLPHDITGGEAEVWDLYAVTQTCTCEWTATLDWIADDDSEKHTSEITDPEGHPCRVAPSLLGRARAGSSWCLEKPKGSRRARAARPVPLRTTATSDTESGVSAEVRHDLVREQL